MVNPHNSLDVYLRRIQGGDVTVRLLWGQLREGSSPFTRTKQYKSEPKADWRRVRICRFFRLSEFQFQARKTKNEKRRSGK